jgi:2-keto-4-pentenoate hydratase/2-oxohepta-3-ene-1,7-dioic acid hydratase in catechol pathway
MKLARVLVQDTPVSAIVDGANLVEHPGGALLGDLGEFRVLAPCQPTKIVAVGRNYAAHAAELGNETPAEPLIFLKPPSAVIGPGAEILYPSLSQRVDHEAELAVVIGKPAWRVPAHRALEYVLGYTCGNDVTARDLQESDNQWTRAKGFDTFCPLGPWIVTDLDPTHVRIQCRVNGQLRQDGNTSQLAHGIPRLLEYISHVMTLLPGDVILTGTPAGISPLHPGDRVDIEIEGLGTLTNTVVASP